MGLHAVQIAVLPALVIGLELHGLAVQLDFPQRSTSGTALGGIGLLLAHFHMLTKRFIQLMIFSRAIHPRFLTRFARQMASSTIVPNPFHHDHHDEHHDHHDQKDHDHHDHHDHSHAEVSHHDHHAQHGQRPPKEYNTITQFLDHKNLFTYFETGPGYMKYPGINYYPAHAHEYDWRDDPKYNPDITILSRHKNCPDPATYVWPFEGRSEYPIYGLTVPTDYLYKPNLIFKAENKRVEEEYTPLKVAVWDPDGEVNHEFDYESEDCDFQAESFKLQHFRKKGPLFGWILAALSPFIYFWAEFLYQHYPDEDHWKITHPPPLNFPDSEDTDDTDTWNDYHRPEGRYLRDIGIAGDLWFDIKDGKKVYDKWAGVNQPLADI